MQPSGLPSATAAPVTDRDALARPWQETHWQRLTVALKVGHLCRRRPTAGSGRQGLATVDLYISSRPAICQHVAHGARQLAPARQLRGAQAGARAGRAGEAAPAGLAEPEAPPSAAGGARAAQRPGQARRSHAPCPPWAAAHEPSGTEPGAEARVSRCDDDERRWAAHPATPRQPTLVERARPSACSLKPAAVTCGLLPPFSSHASAIAEQRSANHAPSVRVPRQPPYGNARTATHRLRTGAHLSSAVQQYSCC